MKKQPLSPLLKETRVNCAKRRIAIKALAAVLLGGAGALAWAAQVAGTIVNLSGPLMVKKADGSMKVLGLKSEVAQGDTLVSEKNTYARIRFIDNSEIILQPGTTFKIEAFAYESAKPDADSASFSLLQGGLRSLTGLLGKRNKEKFELKTPSATIGIRGTTFVARYVAPAQAPALGSASLPVLLTSPLPTGLYVSVIDGAVALTNQAGSQNFFAGQIGYTASVSVAPVMLPANPALKFTLPPGFSAATPPSGSQSMAAPGRVQAVDCEVR
jgi:hypothetical protein